MKLSVVMDSVYHQLHNLVYIFFGETINVLNGMFFHNSMSTFFRGKGEDTIHFFSERGEYRGNMPYVLAWHSYFKFLEKGVDELFIGVHRHHPFPIVKILLPVW